MHTDRRTLLKSLAAAGFAVSGVGWARAATTLPAAATRTDVVAITSALQGSALDAAFMAGVRSTSRAATHADLQGLDSAAFQQLSALLADGKDTQLIGLLDDASATVVLDLVRSAGGRVLAMEQHRVDSEATVWAQRLGASLASGQTSSASTIAAGTESRVSFRCVI